MRENDPAAFVSYANSQFTSGAQTSDGSAASIRLASVLHISSA